VPWWVWVSLGLFVVPVFVATLVAVVPTFRFFRRTKALASALEPRLRRLEAASIELELRNRQVAAAQARLAETKVALDGSIAKTRVLAWALEDVRMVVGVARGLLPSK
jgi:uncharacterized membrane protein